MIQPTNTNVIINKNKDKHKLLLIWDAKEAVIVLVCGYSALKLGQLISSSVGLIFCALVVTVSGGIFIEIKNHLTVYQVIRRWYLYTFKIPHKYFRMPKRGSDFVIIRKDEERK